MAGKLNKNINSINRENLNLKVKKEEVISLTNQIDDQIKKLKETRYVLDKKILNYVLKKKDSK
ncbi:hypothetical protein [Lactococcus cremoris]|uniref:hypothetical protein n=1 Tax=Lactococcus lactis subsp. cremoris TaxID=1359 RepID=UPI000A5B4B80|nr:hypothetical protein [Lactococcus cremoris]QSE64747.1 hypothetical protein JWR96_11875 [Lactococcus cremoris]